MMRRAFVALASLLLVACRTTPKQTADYVDQGTKSVNEVTEAIYQVGLANNQTDASKLSPAFDDFRTFKNQQAAHFIDVKKRLDEQEQALKNLIGTIGGIATTFLPAGTQELGQRIIGMITGAENKTKEVDAKWSEDQVKQEGRLHALEEKVKAHENAAEARAAEESRLQAALDKLSGDLKEKLVNLDHDTALKLSKVSSDGVKELETLKGDSQLFRERLQTLTNMTDKQVESLKGLSTEEILAILTAMGTAAGVGGALGKTGKSRAQPEIDKLRGEVGELLKKKTPT